MLPAWVFSSLMPWCNYQKKSICPELSCTNTKPGRMLPACSFLEVTSESGPLLRPTSVFCIILLNTSWVGLCRLNRTHRPRRLHLQGMQNRAASYLEALPQVC